MIVLDLCLEPMGLRDSLDGTFDEASGERNERTVPTCTQGKHGVFSAVDRGQWVILDQLKVLSRWHDQFLVDVQINLEMIDARMHEEMLCLRRFTLVG